MSNLPHSQTVVLDSIQSICATALATGSRDIQDWVDDIVRIKREALAGMELPSGPEEPPQDWKDIFHEYRRHGRTDAWLYMEIQAHAIRALKNAAPQCPAPEPTKVHSQTKDGEPARASSAAGKDDAKDAARYRWLRDSERGVRVHPTQKPVALMRWCLQQAGNPRSVIDPCMGSSPVGVACVEAGVTYYGVERERRYFDIACRRIDDALRQERLFA